MRQTMRLKLLIFAILVFVAESTDAGESLGANHFEKQSPSCRELVGAFPSDNPAYASLSRLWTTPFTSIPNILGDAIKVESVEFERPREPGFKLDRVTMTFDRSKWTFECTKHDSECYVSEVEIWDPELDLGCGLRVGGSVESFVSQIEPEYRSEAKAGLANGVVQLGFFRMFERDEVTFALSVRYSLFVSSEGKLERVRWSPGAIL